MGKRLIFKINFIKYLAIFYRANYHTRTFYAERNKSLGELSEWPKEHAWKACMSKGIKSSNLLLTAKKSKKDVLGRLFLASNLVICA